MPQKILIIDFGSQVTQLIARRVRENHVYCEIVPCTKVPEISGDVAGIILSGSPASVHDGDILSKDVASLLGSVPVLAICFGAQLLAHKLGGQVTRSAHREYGKNELNITLHDEHFFANWPAQSTVWMSHGDTITKVPDNFELIASTDNIPVAAFRSKAGTYAKPVYAVQFHPEVTHTAHGAQLIKNFVLEICACTGDWTPQVFIESTVSHLKDTIKEDNVVMGLSGGVDSTVAAYLLHHAIGKQLVCLFIDNGLLRLNEYDEVLEAYKGLGLNVKGIDAKEEFYTALKGLDDPEQKRKAIGRTFIEVFDKEAHKLSGVKWLGQGTIYPDVIESVSVHGPSVTIKSHHNVGGLPDKMHLKVIEPLRLLFKDEVREVGKALGIPSNILQRHPFPGPGLAIRIMGDITPAKVELLQKADAIFINALKEFDLYNSVWQAGTILLNTRSVGVMGDERTYEHVVALRAVQSVDGMTADWYPLPHNFLAHVSNAIINRVKGINRVVYDISSKPPATIEWE